MWMNQTWLNSLEDGFAENDGVHDAENAAIRMPAMRA
jgi:hypothetical protein